MARGAATGSPPRGQRGGGDSGKLSGGNRFDVALDPGDLPREQHARMPLHLQRGKQQGGRVDVGVAMNLPVAQEARIFQAGDQPQHARLLAEAEMVLEADQIVGVGAQILLPELHHRVGHLGRCADRAIRPASSARSAACRGRAARSPRWAGSLRSN